ncbi:threonine ammonia-lyase [Clostridia bacterium]|nr:threonine ammonia-lyase [Clostridia bacterium]
MQLKKIEKAAERLNGVIHKTAVNSSRTFSELSGTELYLKCENLQKTGSFKVRGAYNKIVSLAENGPIPALIASSAGNHAQGVAYAASAIGAKATIVMPRGTPIAKISATEGYGAEVILHGDCYDDAYEHAMALKEDRNAVFVHPFDDEEVIAGQGTISLEILKSLPTVNAVLVPAGGGGLLAGMAACIKQINPSVRVIGVQARQADAIVRSFRSKEVVATETSATIADGIAVRKPGEMTTKLIRQFVDEMVTVTDDEIAEAILLLLERTKMVVEPAGAASLAAALNHKADLAGKRVVCLLSGGNIDVGFIHKVVEKGLVTRGRQMKFQTVMKDAPGSLQKFSALVAERGANIIMVQHDRLNTSLQLGDAILHVACEVSSREHGMQLVRALETSGYIVKMES